MIKDHLGNVRMVLTDEVQQDKYPTATLEPSKIATEQNYYAINTAQVVDKSEALGITAYVNDNGIGNNPADASFSTSNSTKLYKLNSNSTKTGLGITLKVMAGDKVDVFGKSYYFQNTSGTGGNSLLPVTDLLTSFLGAPAAATTTAAHGTITAATINTPSGTTGISNMITQQDNQSNASPYIPRAFINVIFFDEQFKAVDFRTSMVGSNSTLKDHYSELQNLIANKSGFVYIYCSNESPVNVFFDNLQVVQTRSPILEETHYYPFGLTMAGISSRAAGGTENKKKFNDGTELNNDFNIGIYETDFRLYDPQIGKFLQLDELAEEFENWSPYTFANDNPILLNDPTGLASDTSWKQLSLVTVRAIKNTKPGYSMVNYPGVNIKKSFDPNSLQVQYNSYTAWNHPTINQHTTGWEMVKTGLEMASWIIPWGRVLKGAKTIYTLNKLRQLNKAARILQRVNANKILHIINGSKYANHAWDKVLSNPNDWNSVSNIIGNVLDNGVSLSYGTASSKVLQISGEVVQVTYGTGADGLIRIGDAWVVTNPSIKYEALKVLTAVK